MTRPVPSIPRLTVDSDKGKAQGGQDWKRVVREAARQGWTVEFARRGQLKLIPPDPTKQIVVIHGSPSDHRAIKNAIAVMRRQGFKWPPKGKGNR